MNLSLSRIKRSGRGELREIVFFLVELRENLMHFASRGASPLACFHEA